MTAGVIRLSVPVPISVPPGSRLIRTRLTHPTRVATLGTGTATRGVRICGTDTDSRTGTGRGTGTAIRHGDGGVGTGTDIRTRPRAQQNGPPPGREWAASEGSDAEDRQVPVYGTGAREDVVC